MFIKPVEIGAALNASNTWTDLASNNHFILQQQHQLSMGGGTVGYSPPLTTSIRSMLSAATNTILTLPSTALSSVASVTHLNTQQQRRNSITTQPGLASDWTTPPNTPATFRKNRTVRNEKRLIVYRWLHSSRLWISNIEFY
jgi:hypothetical protein